MKKKLIRTDDEQHVLEQNLELIKDWNDGDCVTSMSMGGIGPGYEQAIQILVMQIIEDHMYDDVTKLAKAKSFAGKALKKHDKQCGFSGAQVGAAKNLAYNILKTGHKHLLDEFKEKKLEERIIIVSKKFP